MKQEQLTERDQDFLTRTQNPLTFTANLWSTIWEPLNLCSQIIHLILIT